MSGRIAEIRESIGVAASYLVGRGPRTYRRLLDQYVAGVRPDVFAHSGQPISTDAGNNQQPTQ